MTKIFMALFLVSSFANQSFANDGAYRSSGGIFYPMIESRISIEKEILTFRCEAQESNVNIYFEFLNPEKKSITSMIGFVAPFPSGDIDEEDYLKKSIRNFRVQHEGFILSYDLKMADCPDCELRDTSEFVFDQFNSQVFVYLFEVTFKSGINRISHSYDFNASSSNDYGTHYGYTLTTGAKWAGNAIKDLTVEIEMVDDNYFYVNDIFGASSDWMIVGNGKVATEAEQWGEYKLNMVRMLTGKLVIHVEEYIPKSDLFFGFFGDDYCNYRLNYDGQGSKVNEAICVGELDVDNTYKKHELRLIRNGIYATYGYAFKSKDLKEYFGEFDWYMPDPNLTMGMIRLSYDDQEFVEMLIEMENEFK